MRDIGGPLSGIRVVELAGLGAVPYAGMMLSDMGADVVRIDRPGARSDGVEFDVMSRGRRSVTIDLKSPEGLEVLLALLDRADVLMEGYRPGVAERLGFGPEVCLERNPRLVYGRMTGWGQTGPLAQQAGHDLNYLALTGALGWIQGGGDAIVPTLPGMVSDLAGGGLMLGFGITSALVRRSVSGCGQVVDASMVDGAASLTSMVFAKIAQGFRIDQPGANFFDGSSPFYGVYATLDGRRMAVAAVEPQFWAELIRVLGLDPAEAAQRDDLANWPALKQQVAAKFASKAQDEWVTIFADVDACVTPVLDFEEAAAHPHMRDRAGFVRNFDVVQPAPTPRFSVSGQAVAGPPPRPGEHSYEVLHEWGLPAAEVQRLMERGIVKEGSDRGSRTFELVE